MSAREVLAAWGPHPGDTCGYAMAGPDGTEEPCGLRAETWRWYQDVEHEDCLERACVLHGNRGGVQVAAMRAALGAVLDLHKPVYYDGNWCAVRIDVDTIDEPGATGGAVAYPCPTVAVIEQHLNDETNGDDDE